MSAGQTLFLQKWTIRADILTPVALTAEELAGIEKQSLSTVTVQALCKRAKIPYRVTGGYQPMIKLGYFGGHFRGLNKNNRSVFFVDLAETAETEPEKSVRILEILAHGFHDYAARESVRGLFTE